MASFIGDIPLPRGVWTRLTPGGPSGHFAVMNIGVSTVLIKKSAAIPTGAGGAMSVGPSRMLPPEDLTRHGLDVWALSEAYDGVVAVEAVVTL